MIDFLSGVLGRLAQADPAAAFQAVHDEFSGYSSESFEEGSVEPSEDGSPAPTTRLVLDLTDEDGDPDDSTTKVVLSHYDDGRISIELPYLDLLLTASPKAGLNGEYDYAARDTRKG